MSLPARRQRSHRRWGWLTRLLRDEAQTLLQDDPTSEVVDVELWVIPMLSGPRAQRLAAYERCFGVLILMNTVSRGRVLLFDIRQPLRRRAVTSLIVSMAVQLRARRNRARTGARRLQSSARASGRSA